MATVSEALAIALQHHQASQLEAAEQIYRQILQVEPNHADAIHFLGLIAHQVGKHEIAIEYMERAVRLKGTEVGFHLNLAEAYRAVHRIPEAVACNQRALELKPDFAEAHYNLGIALKDQGNLEEAVTCYRRALELKPDLAEAHFSLGVALNDQGNLEEAVASYRRALELKPDYAVACSNLGVALKGQGNLEEAVACYRRVLKLKPELVEAHFNLGIALKDQGNLEEAVACYRRALELKPDFAEACSNLGVALKDQGNLEEAVACYRRFLELKPELVEVHNNLGSLLHDQGKLEGAVACYRRALELKPDYAEAYNNLGIALKDQGNLKEAVASYRRALELKPDYAVAYNSLGVALKGQGKLEEAVACYRRALELKPDYAEAYNNLGIALQDQGKLEEAAACCRRALELKPDFAEAHSNLGSVLKDQGELDETVACYRRALELKPDDAAVHSNLVYTLNFCPSYDNQRIYEEHLRWATKHAKPLAGAIQSHAHDRNLDRRLKVGYVSPDFNDHPVGRFLAPLLESHDHARFEIFCYASVQVSDEITDRCRAQADVWRNVLGFSDERVADVIRQDSIDILVDLSMHTAKNRLPVFARKPAPVQVTYLAYCGTTGLSTMDYRLTDPYLDPADHDDKYYSEQSMRLPETYWCYRPTGKVPEVNPLPALHGGPFTFGSLNNFCKVTAPTLQLWSRILQELPQARLILHANRGSHRDRVLGYFAGQGISPERLIFVEMTSKAVYFRLYQQIDMALDPFPYGGGTTTCDALWMGVPVVSLAGQTAVGRGGLSILSNIGLPNLVAYDPEQYMKIAVELARDLPRLSQLRATLRYRMQSSPLMDAPRFTRNVEAAYRRMWQHWCSGE